jgi:hypothetical protein
MVATLQLLLKTPLSLIRLLRGELSVTMRACVGQRTRQQNLCARVAMPTLQLQDDCFHIDSIRCCYISVYYPHFSHCVYVRACVCLLICWSACSLSFFFPSNHAFTHRCSSLSSQTTTQWIIYASTHPPILPLILRIHRSIFASIFPVEHSLTRSLTHSLSLTRSLTHSLSLTLSYPFTRSSILFCILFFFRRLLRAVVVCRMCCVVCSMHCAF